jgi:acyl carrier protein
MTASDDFADPFMLVAKALDRPTDAITLDSAMYRDHGWDSFGHVGVILALEEAYGVTISVEDVGKYTSMRSIVELHDRVKGTQRGV